MQNLDSFAEKAIEAAALLKAMGNPHRLMILCSIVDKEMQVNQLNEQVALSQSSLSQHLAALRKANLVTTRRESQTIYYKIKGEAVLSVIKTLKMHYCPD